jgi:tripartite-type tricarboxylate transporter receptor subunit TctC
MPSRGAGNEKLFRRAAFSFCHRIHVPYKGSTPALTDRLGGQVLVMFVNLSPALTCEVGKLRALAVTTLLRTRALPDVPTIAESGLPGFETVAWFGFLGPAGTPCEVVERLNAEINKAAQTQEAKERVAAPVWTSKAQFAGCCLGGFGLRKVVRRRPSEECAVSPYSPQEHVDRPSAANG